MNIFFTADTHFDHTNIIKYCDRPFDNVDEMNEIIIQRWNEVVRQEDAIYHLGDFCMGSFDRYIDRLNGTIFIIRGDHDYNLPFGGFKTYKDKPKGIIEDSHIETISPKRLLDEYGNQRTITLCHWPMRSWHKSHYASWHLYGHHHGKLEPYGLSFDVGVDTHDFYPYSLDEIQEKMATLLPVVDYRNKEK